MESYYLNKKHERYFSTSRTEINLFIKNKIDRALEIGCGNGATLNYLKANKLVNNTTGIDINKNALEIAKKNGVDEIYCGDVNSIINSLPENSYDVILFLDVLEHLYDPWEIVNKSKKLLKPDGYIIASIPNTQNFRVILPLVLLGRWTYKDCGLLDFTHIRFFTKKTAINLFESNDLKTKEIKSLPDNNIYIRLLNLLTLRLMNRFFTLQFLLKVGIK